MRFFQSFYEHPKGLFYLFFTEMWERFSYYGMRAILVLYLTEKTTAINPGLGWSNGDALALYGWYTMLVYVASIPGGFLADQVLGQRRTVMLGGALLCLGHLVLTIEAMWAFYTGLLLIVLGVGGLKPNISTMVGALYKEGDTRRDKGFMIFYMGINIGAFLSSILVGWLGESMGWHYGFGLAGVCMILGQVTYVRGQKHLQHVGNLITEKVDGVSSTSLSKLFKQMISFAAPRAVVSFGFLLSGYILFTHSVGYGLLCLFLSLVTGIMMVIYRDLNDREKDKYLVLLISFVIVIVFWGAFEQAGGLMNLYTAEKIDRSVFGFEIPTSWFQSTNALFIILLGIPVSVIWFRIKKSNREASSIFKMAVGTIIMGLGFLFMAKASMEAASEPFGKGLLIWLILAYAFHTTGELCASPVALSFITKLSPKRYAAVMMGLYFAATGLGSKVAGVIGEMTQTEPVEVQIASQNYKAEGNLEDAKSVLHRGSMGLSVQDLSGNVLIPDLVSVLSMDQRERVASFLGDQDILYTKVSSEKYASGYRVTFNLLAEENEKELRVFLMIASFAVGFGLVLYLFLGKLKKMTHGVEDQNLVESK